MDMKSFSQQDLLEKRVLGFVVRHPVVDLDGIHDEDVADDGDDELRDPERVTKKIIFKYGCKSSLQPTSNI